MLECNLVLIEELVRHKEHHPGDGVFESREITNAVVIRYSEHFSHSTIEKVRRKYDTTKIDKLYDITIQILRKYL